MPLPAAVEDQISDIEAAVEPFNDALVTAFIALSVSEIPSWRSLSDDLRPRIERVIKDTLTANGAPFTATFVEAQTDRVLNQLRTVWDKAAREMTRQIRATKKENDRQGPALWLKTVAAVAAGKLVTRSRSIRNAARKVAANGGRFPRTVLKLASEQFGVKHLGRRINIESHMKMILRTEAAKIRNRNAASHASRQGLVILVRDAFIGNDEPCTSVNRRYATPAWLRTHQVAHPNCTREGTAVELPEGARVTLT